MEHIHKISVSEIMVRDVVSLHSEDTMWTAHLKMKTHRIKHLPVLNDEDELVGVFSETDFYRAYSPRETEDGWYYDRNELVNLKPVHYMTDSPSSLNSDNSIKDACRKMVTIKIGCLPIIDSSTNKLVGIISHDDILKKIVELFDA